MSRVNYYYGWRHKKYALKPFSFPGGCLKTRRLFFLSRAIHAYLAAFAFNFSSAFTQKWLREAHKNVKVERTRWHKIFSEASLYDSYEMIYFFSLHPSPSIDFVQLSGRRMVKMKLYEYVDDERLIGERLCDRSRRSWVFLKTAVKVSALKWLVSFNSSTFDELTQDYNKRDTINSTVDNRISRRLNWVMNFKVVARGR